jgi:thioredoxin-like negative regulator of GroEL
MFPSSWAIEIDVDFLKKEVSQNPYDINSRLVLARSYISQNSYDEAKKLLDEVLLIDKKNQKARFLLKDIKKLKQIESLVQSGKLSQSSKLTAYFDKLSQAKQYQYITMFGDVLKRNNITLSPDVEFYIINSYIHMKNYNKAETVLAKSSLSSQNRHFMMAKIYAKKGESILSEQEYKAALKMGDRKDIVLGLYDVYVKQNKTDAAKTLVKLYKQKGAKSSIFNALQKRDQKLTDKIVAGIRDNYRQKGSFDALKQYYYALEGIGKRRESISVLTTYVKKHPKNEESALFLAKIHHWNHKSKLGISVLKPIISKTKNREILKLYAEMLLQSNQREKAYSYMKKLALLGDHKSKIELDKIETNSLLEHAIKAHKLKNYPQAIRYYKAYYLKTKKSKIAKEIAELHFVLKQAEESLPFYEAYLSENQNDNRIRFRYASALDSLKLYHRAELEYKKVARTQDDLYSLASYRYASSMIAQKNEEKWNHSRVVLQNLLQTLQNQTPSKSRDELLKFTQAALEKVNMPMPKPTRYKDVILAEGQKKILGSESPFLGSKLIKRDISSVKSMLQPVNVLVNQPKQKDVTLSFHTLEDDTISNLSYGIRLNNITKVADGTLSVEAKKSRFKTSQIKYNVDSFMAHFNYKNFSLGMGMSHFGDFSDIDAEVTYHKVFSGHNMTFGLKTTNGAFVNSNACMIDNKINVMQFSLYDAILLSNLNQAEVGLTLNRYDDENINLNSWLEYPIYKIIYKNFENDFSLSGSYEFNTKTDTCYYSTEFFDGNYIQTRPKILFGKNSFIQGIGGIGYSFKNSDFLYNYGLNAQIALMLFDIRIDCRHYQSGYSPDGADECYMRAVYKW